MHVGLVRDLRHVRPRGRRFIPFEPEGEDTSRRRRELFNWDHDDPDEHEDERESDRERDEDSHQPQQAATCTQSEPAEIDLTLSPESEDGDTSYHHDTSHADDDSDDEVQIVGWTASGEPSEPVKFEPRKRRRRVSDPNGVESTAVTVDNNEALERFRAALRCSICLDHIRKMTSTHCGHVFCGPCIRAQIRVNRKCPLCQRRLQSTDVHPLFF